MVWFKVDDALHSHPKARRAGLAAIGLWALAGSHCMAYLTDGYVERWVVESWPDGVALARRLVDAGLWDTHPDGGWVFHDWRLYQPTKAQVDEDRRKERERKAAWRESKRSGTDAGRPGGTTDGSPDVSPEGGPGGSHGSPTRPGPTRPGPSSSGVTGGGAVTSGNAREAAAPPGNLDPSNPRCPRHLSVPAAEMGPNCRGCRQVREWCESAPERGKADEVAARRSRREAIDACGLCDDTGYVLGVEPVRRCSHLRPAQES